MKKFLKPPYYIGIDQGTNSVGFAVTDENYNLLKYKHKDMWGIHLFDAANTAAERREKRSNRRRNYRKKQRIDLLQMLFAEEINKVDDTFFLRLDESRLHLEDKSTEAIHPLFNDKNYTDIDYYKAYPTIFHLRKELITSKEPHDIRLVYLAIHNIMKNRGHFLIEGSLSDARDFEYSYNKFMEALCSLGLDAEVTDVERFKELLKDKNIAKSKKIMPIVKLINTSREELNKSELKKNEVKLKEVVKLIVGNKGNLNTIFEGFEGFEEIKESDGKCNFSSASYEKICVELEDKCYDATYILDSIKRIFDWSILVEILDDEEHLSFAKVKLFKKHKEDLHDLRRIVKKYGAMGNKEKGIKSDKQKLFDEANEEDSYTAYVGYLKKNGKTYPVVKRNAKSEDFFKNIKKILSKMKVEEKDRTLYERLLYEAEEETLLPLLRSKDNGVIPMQVHKDELVCILDNAKKYLPFLNNEEDGKTIADKILDIFTFRIPYYVGPLSKGQNNNNKNAWIVRKEEGYIYPWNFEQKVDEEKSNELFIRRMTRKCTYLSHEDVLPKNSLTYQKFMVLNELNNLKIRGKKISVALKQEIYEEVFMKHSKVKEKNILNYLKLHDSALTKEDLAGFEDEFKASLTSYLDFKNQVFGDRFEEEEVQKMTEDIIRWITIYGDDSKMVERVIRKTYPDKINESEMRAIKRLRYTGWGNLSEKFLKGLYDVFKDTGEYLNLMGFLWNTNCNLMQLLSQEYNFLSEIDKHNREYTKEIGPITYDALISELHVSPATKRSIWQTIKTVEEIKKLMGYAPKKIFIEMARGGEKDKKRTVSRKQRLLDLYSACEDDCREWTEEIERKEERDFNSTKLYLYYLQQGKCMYSGEKIDIDELTWANSKWDRDHIYPQSKIKDDSLDNLVLVKKTENQRKSNELLSEEIQKKMSPFWRELLRGGFISKKKFDRLTRKDDFSDEELAGFINRQIVETRQSNKVTAELLKAINTDSEIIYVKSILSSEFRKNELKMLKTRIVNDYHHAKDAYLAIVVGNVYNTKYTDNPLKWMRDNRDRNYSINKTLWYDVYDRDGNIVWEAPLREEYDKKILLRDDRGVAVGGSIETVKRMMIRNTVRYTEYTYKAKGELFNASHARKGTNSNIPLKKGMDPEKYGGYVSPNISYFVLVQYRKKKKIVKTIAGIPIYIANMNDASNTAVMDYLENTLGMHNSEIIKDKIKMNSLIVLNGFPVRLRGYTTSRGLCELKPAMQLILGEESTETARLIEKYLEKSKGKFISITYDGINEENTLVLYDEITEKMGGPLYINRPSGFYELLKSNRQCFEELSLENRVEVLRNILYITGCEKSSINLKLINGSSETGRIRKPITSGVLKFVNQSITGLISNEEVVKL